MYWIVLAGIVLFAFAPMIPLAICEIFYKGFDYVNESNSIIGALPWLLFFTVPIGAIAGLIWVIYGVILLVG